MAPRHTARERNAARRPREAAPRDMPMSTFAEHVRGTATADRLAWILFAAVLYLGYGNYQLRGQLDVVCAANGRSTNVYGAYPLSDPEHAKAICEAQRGE